MNKIDKRTESYFGTIKSTLQYRGRNDGWDTMLDILKKNSKVGEEYSDYEEDDTYSDGFNNASFTIGRYAWDGNDVHFAQVGYQTAIDDYNIETLIFGKRPSCADITTIRQVFDIEFSIKCARFKQVFTCWECGRGGVHWLDIDGSLLTKYNLALDKYCGC